MKNALSLEWLEQEELREEELQEELPIKMNNTTEQPFKPKGLLRDLKDGVQREINKIKNRNEMKKFTNSCRFFGALDSKKVICIYNKIQ